MTPISAPPIIAVPVEPPNIHALILAELQKQTPLLQVIAAYLNNGAPK